MSVASAPTDHDAAKRPAPALPLGAPMPHVEYASEGRLLFRTESSDGGNYVPRIGEVVVIEDSPYQVVDVEYWARRLGSTDRRMVWPTVYVVPIPREEWEQRLRRRTPRQGEGAPPLRY